MPEEEDSSLIGGQHAEGALDGHSGDDTLGLARAVAPAIGVLDRHALGTASLPPQLVQGGVRGDAVAPRGHSTAAVEPTDSRRDRDEGVLGSVPGVLRIAEDAAADGEDGGILRAEERFDGCSVPTSGARRERVRLGRSSRAEILRNADDLMWPGRNFRREPVVQVGVIRLRKLAIVALASGAAALALAGCSGDGAASRSPAIAHLGAHNDLNSATAGDGGGGNASPGGVSSAGVPAGGTKSAASNSSTGVPGVHTLGISVTPVAPLIIRSGDVSVTVGHTDVMTAFDTISNDAITLGGYVSSSASGALPNDRGGANITVRVPTSRFAELATEVDKLGKVTAQQLNGRNVTSQSIDLVARITNLKTEEGALRALMGRAGSIPDILQVQNELFSVESDIEVLSSEESSLVARATYGTLSVALTPKALPPSHRPHAHPQGVVSRATHLAGHNTIAALRAVSVAVGWTFPALVVAAAAGVILWLRRRLGRRHVRTAEAAGNS